MIRVRLIGAVAALISVITGPPGDNSYAIGRVSSPPLLQPRALIRLTFRNDVRECRGHVANEDTDSIREDLP